MLSLFLVPHSNAFFEQVEIDCKQDYGKHNKHHYSDKDVAIGNAQKAIAKAIDDVENGIEERDFLPKGRQQRNGVEHAAQIGQGREDKGGDDKEIIEFLGKDRVEKSS